MVVRFPEKMIRKYIGGKEKEYGAKKSNFLEKGVERVFSALWLGKTECV